MLEAATAIASYAQRGRDAFDADAALRDAILYQMVVLGEAAKAVVNADSALAGELSEVEWSPLARMRDRLTHRYWATDREIVWLTAIQDIPVLREVLSKAIARLE
jgi:uncharacterized protein with HEPN domain